MASNSAYTPGLIASPRTFVSRERELPLAGKALVSIGDRVSSDTIVLEAEMPGDLEVVRLNERLGLDPEDIIDHVLVSIGQNITKGDLLCEVSSFFGLFKSRLQSPMSGTVEFFNAANAHLGIRQASQALSIKAYLEGLVTQVRDGRSVTIEVEASLVQGIFGVGGESTGALRSFGVCCHEMVTAKTVMDLGESVRGAILFGGAQINDEALSLLGEMKASGAITGSIDSRSLARYVKHEVSASTTGDEDVPFPLMITEGFGFLPMSERVNQMLKERESSPCSISGVTQVRAGACRPEAIIPIPVTLKTPDQANNEWAGADFALKEGSLVKLIREPYFGMNARVACLPREPQAIETGAVVRIAIVQLEDGQEAKVPRANLELTGSIS